MDCINNDVFSPIRNTFDEEKNNRQSDGFSEFLKGPDIFKKKSANLELLEHVDENTPINNISNTKSVKAQQQKTVFKSLKSKETLPSSTSIHDIALAASLGKSNSIKKDKSKNKPLASKKNDKMKTNQPTGSEHNAKKCDLQSAKKHFEGVAKSSLQPGITAASGSKEIKKVDKPSSVTRNNSLSQVKKEKKKMKSGALEKIINDAVESRVDDIQKTLWSHHLNLLKTINNIQDEMEQRRAENTTMFKIIEQLLDENRLLRTALLARQ